MTDSKCQFRLNADEEVRKGSMNFVECGKKATRNFIIPEPITQEPIILDLCDEHFQYMTKEALK